MIEKGFNFKFCWRVRFTDGWGTLVVAASPQRAAEEAKAERLMTMRPPATVVQVRRVRP